MFFFFLCFCFFFLFLLPLLLLLLLRVPSGGAFGLWRGKKEKDGLPPGSMGWPLLGETLEFLASKTSLTSQAFVEERIKRHGSLFKSHLFGQPFIISTDAVINCFILENEGVYFKSCQPINKYREILGFQTLTETYGELHKKIHSVSTSLLKPESLKDHAFEFIQDLIQKRLATWQDQIVHVQHEATEVVLCLTLNHLIGLSPEDVEMEKLYDYCSDVKSLLSFPINNILGSCHTKCLQGCKNLVKFLEKRITSRCGINAENPKNFLDALHEIMGDEVPSSKSTLILDNIRGILFHAEETTSIAMTLLLRFISKSPEALNQLKKEQSAITKAETITWEDYESMHFTRNVINETLRLANVVPWVVRVAEQDVKIKGFVIPKGWKVFAFLMNAHLDEIIYSDPKSFNPSRWQDTTKSPHFMAFGSGPRCCPGTEITKMTLAIFLRVLVTKYSWELVEDDELIRFPTLTFQEGLPVAVTSIDNADECLILH